MGRLRLMRLGMRFSTAASAPAMSIRCACISVRLARGALERVVSVPSALFLSPKPCLRISPTFWVIGVDSVPVGGGDAGRRLGAECTRTGAGETVKVMISVHEAWGAAWSMQAAHETFSFQ